MCRLRLVGLLIFLPMMGLAGEPNSGANHHLKKATFAGGCFWCMEPPFEELDGVKESVSGYMGGDRVNPTYKEVSAGTTGHAEVVQVTYDPKVVSYEKLLEVFWQNIDPTDTEGQFVDRGNQYRPEIFYHSESQRQLAEVSKKKLQELKVFKKPITTSISPAASFYKAEDDHQDYYKKNVTRYKIYRYRSGRDQFLSQAWHEREPLQLFANKASEHQVREVSNATLEEWKSFKKPSTKELKSRLNELQYEVTQKDGTEKPFKNAYWDNKEEGIYVDVVSGEPLFSSKHKFDSGTGWPSFTQPLEPDNIVKKRDIGWLGVRTEVRSKYADSHLGHVFKDGPGPTGLRYCINSAALEFIPLKDLRQRGYGKYWEDLAGD